MSVTELPPTETTPEEPLLIDPDGLESAPRAIDVDEATIALEGAAREVVAREGGVARPEEVEDFNSKLSAFILEKSSVKHGEGRIKPPVARTSRERKKLEKAINKADKVVFKRSQKNFADDIFTGNAVYSKARVRTVVGGEATNTQKERNRLHDEALSAYEAAQFRFQAGEIDEEALEESEKLFHDRSREARGSVVWQSSRAQNKARRRLDRAERKIQAKFGTPRNNVGSETRPNEHTASEAEIINPEPVVTELADVVAEVPELLVPERELTPLEQLQKMRAEGKLPAPTPKTDDDKLDEEIEASPEVAAKPVLTGLEEIAELFSFVEAGVDDPLLYEEIMSRKANIRADYYMSGGRPAYQGADDYIDQTRHDYYDYVYTNAEGKTVKERMSDELAKKILAFEPPIKSPETDKTPAKKATPKPKAKSTPKKRAERTVPLEDLAKELGYEDTENTN